MRVRDYRPREVGEEYNVHIMDQVDFAKKGIVDWVLDS